MVKTTNLTSVNPDISTQKNIIPWIAILGNPNCGKTALFNRLTGLHHKVGNYPGITVEQKSGWLRGENIQLRDLPGSYSLNARSEDERIVEDLVQGWRKKENRPIAAIVVLDATNVARSLYLALQVMDWDVPVILVLNMIDEARKKGLTFNVEHLKNNLKADHIVLTSARSGEGIDDVLQSVKEIRRKKTISDMTPRLILTGEILEVIAPISDFLKVHQEKLKHNYIVESLRLLSNDRYKTYLKPYLNEKEFQALEQILQGVIIHCHDHKIDPYNLEQESRFRFIDSVIDDAVGQRTLLTRSTSEKLDAVLTHRIWGPIILLGVLAFIFNAIFSWAQFPMETIDQGVQWLSGKMMEWLPQSATRDLIVEGIIAGVGSILIFFPQIILLILFITLLEDSGYMARMAFMMDRLLGKIGLHGRSVLPLLSGFACAIPAVMASRTIENRRDRLITIMLIPLMSCSARLPVYTILIAAFVPTVTIMWIFSLQGLLLMAIYTLGVITAVIVAYVLKKLMPQKEKVSLMMELPPYRIPLMRSVWWQIYDRAKSFLITAGSIIMAMSIILWFLASFPKQDTTESVSAAQQIEASYAGQLGKVIEPVIKPLGYDWKIGIGLITSFAAREVIISTLSTLYNVSSDEGATSLLTAMQKDRYPDGRRVFTPLVAISLMVFFAYAAQCMATFAIVKKETNTWRWPLYMVLYLTVFAYIGAFVVYQTGQLLGYA